MHRGDEPLIGPEELLKHASWARALARRLVRDRAEADDVVQETWLAALEKPPRADRPLRPWLARVLGNKARMRARTNRRRSRREHAVAQPDRQADTPDRILAELESHQMLTELVMNLEEPFRTTLLLRYYRDWTAADIARKQSTPPGTVRWRIQRGLTLLRQALDARHAGDRKRWHNALAALTVPTLDAMGTTLSLGGAVALSTTTKFLVGGAVVALLVLGWHVSDRAPWSDTPTRTETRRTRAADARSNDTDAKHAVPKSKDGESIEPSRARRSTPAAPGANPIAAPTSSVSFRVVDTNKNAVSGCDVHIRHAGEIIELRAGADGRLVAALKIKDNMTVLDLSFRADGYATRTMRTQAKRDSRTALGDIALEPGGSLVGRVVDQEGKPVAHAQVGWSQRPFTDADINHLRHAPLAAVAAQPFTATDADGRFRITGIPIGSQRVWVEAADYWNGTHAPAEIHAGRETAGVIVRLEAKPANATIQGVALTPEGKPASGVELSYEFVGDNTEGGGGTTVEDDGTFQIEAEEGAVYIIEVRDPEGRWGAARRTDVRATGATITLRLSKIRYMTVRATGTKGAAVSTFRVRMRRPDAEFDLPIDDVEAGADGAAKVPLPAGAFMVIVDADHHALATLGPYASETAPADAQAQLQELPGIRGTVTANGKPVADARVTLHKATPTDRIVTVNRFPVRSQRSPTAQTRTNKNGAYRLTLRGQGRFVVRAEADGLAPASSDIRAFDATVGDDVPLQITRGGSIAGRVRTEDGKAAPGVIVAISRADGFAQTQRSDANGAFRFDALTPGPWLVTRTDKEIHPRAQRVRSRLGAEPIPHTCTVRAGSTTKHDLLVADARAPSVEGLVTITGGNAKGWNALLMPPRFQVQGSQRSEALLGESGVFRLRAPHAGKWRVLLRAERGQLVVWRDIEVTRPEQPIRFTLALGRAQVEAQESVALIQTRDDGTVIVGFGKPKNGIAAIDPAPLGSARLVRIDTHEIDPQKWPLIREIEVK